MATRRRTNKVIKPRVGTPKVKKAGGKRNITAKKLLSGVKAAENRRVSGAKKSAKRAAANARRYNSKAKSYAKKVAAERKKSVSVRSYTRTSKRKPKGFSVSAHGRGARPKGLKYRPRKRKR